MLDIRKILKPDNYNDKNNVVSEYNEEFRTVGYIEDIRLYMKMLTFSSVGKTVMARIMYSNPDSFGFSCSNFFRTSGNWEKRVLSWTVRSMKKIESVHEEMKRLGFRMEKFGRYSLSFGNKQISAKMLSIDTSEVVTHPSGAVFADEIIWGGREKTRLKKSLPETVLEHLKDCNMETYVLLNNILRDELQRRKMP